HGGHGDGSRVHPRTGFRGDKGMVSGMTTFQITGSAARNGGITELAGNGGSIFLKTTGVQP
ncbi:MAG TPA: hypothetical protein DDW83_00440, partial [Peptococcaceae bacterium]|nr:hypothetical protein [Peptococcaceae bacterium]